VPCSLVVEFSCGHREDKPEVSWFSLMCGHLRICCLSDLPAQVSHRFDVNATKPCYVTVCAIMDWVGEGFVTRLRSARCLSVIVTELRGGIERLGWRHQVKLCSQKSFDGEQCFNVNAYVGLSVWHPLALLVRLSLCVRVRVCLRVRVCKSSASVSEREIMLDRWPHISSHPAMFGLRTFYLQRSMQHKLTCAAV
jgi:hypothetical protein